MNIELKEIDKDKVKVGDVVGVASKVECGWGSSFRHSRIIPAKIVKITPKRTKIVSDKFGEHDKYENFYELNEDAAQETILAEEVGELGNPGWIPCSERLPENAMNVIAQFSDGTVTELRYAGNGIFEGIYEYSTRVIIAWMPLPEPYEGE